MKTLTIIGTEKDDVESLKAEFLAALAQLEGGLNSLRDVVVQLLDADVSKDELLDWATAAGYSESYTRTVLSQILISAGRRARKTGAGPKTSEEALTLARTAVELFEGNAAKMLLAAYRALVSGKVSTKRKYVRFHRARA